MPRIRVLIAGLPPLLGGIVVDALSEQPDIEVVALIARGVAFEPLAARHLADVLIVGADVPHDAAKADHLLLDGSAARVVLIAMTGDEAVLYEMHPEKTLLGELSPQGLVQAIRGLDTRVTT